MYVDESYDRKSNYTIMAGFIVPLSKWKELNFKIRDLKLNYFKESNINLKALRRKKYDKHKLWGSLTKEEKIQFNKEFYNIISQEDYVIIAGIIDKNKMKDKDKNLLFYLCYSFILERFEYFLDDKKSYGLVVMDYAEASKEIKSLQRTHKEALESGIRVRRKDLTLKISDKEYSFKGYKRRQINNVCEQIIFLNDNYNHILQVVDMIAAAIFAKFNRKTDNWFEKIRQVIRTSGDGKILGYGLKFFPEKPKDILI